MAAYRHILVIPPTAKVVTVEKRKTAYHQNITSVLHYRRKNTAIYFVLPLPPKKYRRKVPPALNTAKRVPPTLDTAQKVPPTLDTAQKVPPILDTAQKVPPALDTAQEVPAFLFVDGFNLLEFWSRRGTDSVCPTTGKVTSPAEMP